MLSNYCVKSIILVIDDEPEVLELVGFNLQQSGFSVATVTNGCGSYGSKRDARIVTEVFFRLSAIGGASERDRSHSRDEWSGLTSAATVRCGRKLRMDEASFTDCSPSESQ
jgi:hypothetical protein